MICQIELGDLLWIFGKHFLSIDNDIFIQFRPLRITLCRYNFNNCQLFVERNNTELNWLILLTSLYLNLLPQLISMILSLLACSRIIVYELTPVNIVFAALISQFNFLMNKYRKKYFVWDFYMDTPNLNIRNMFQRPIGIDDFADNI